MMRCNTKHRRRLAKVKLSARLLMPDSHRRITRRAFLATTVSVTQSHGGCPLLARLRTSAGETPVSALGRLPSADHENSVTAYGLERPAGRAAARAECERPHRIDSSRSGSSGRWQPPTLSRRWRLWKAAIHRNRPPLGSRRSICRSVILSQRRWCSILALARAWPGLAVGGDGSWQ